jgi:hypothetical protein
VAVGNRDERRTHMTHIFGSYELGAMPGDIGAVLRTAFALRTA